MGWTNAGGWSGRGWGKAAAAGSGTVSRDAIGNFTRFTPATATATYTGITVGAGANALVALVGLSNEAVSHISSVTWNGAAMTLIASIGLNGNFSCIAAYGILSPASGAQNLVVNVDDATNEVAIGAVSFVGVNGTFATAFPSANVATATSNGTSVTSESATPTSGTGHMTLGFGRVNNAAANTITLTPASIMSAFATGPWRLAAATNNGATTYTATADVADEVSVVAIDIAP